MPDAVPVLSSNRKHRLIGFFDASALLTDFFSVGCEDRSRLIRYKNGGMLASVIADSAVLSCRNASGGIGNNGIGIHINEIQSRFSTPTA